MRGSLWAGALVAALAWGSMAGVSNASVAVAADGGAGFAKVQLMLKKLRDSMAGLKDLDELERAGMAHADVERMRRVLKRKIQQMIDDTIISIQEI